jgi:TP901 family phage tail tape measure protein
MAKIGELSIIFRLLGIKAATAQLKTFNRIVGRVERSLAAFIAVLAVRKGMQGLANMVKEIGRIERGMAELQRTTGIAGKGLEGLQSNLLQLSKEMAGSLEDIQGAAIAFGRAGVTIREELLEGVKVAAMMGTITERSFAQTADSLISLSRVFGATDLRDNIMEIAGAAIVVGRKFSVTSDEIVLATQRMGTAIATLNIPEREAILLAGALAEVIGRASLAGRELNSAFVQMAKKIGAVANLLEMTESEVKELFATNPLEFILRVLEALRAIENEVDRFNTTVKVAGTVGAKALGPLIKRAPQLREKLAELNAEFEKGDPLSRDYAIATKQLGFYLERMDDTIRVTLIRAFLELKEVMIDLVKATTNLAEVSEETLVGVFERLADLLEPVTRGLHFLSAAFSNMHGMVIDITDPRFIEFLRDVREEAKELGIDIEPIIKILEKAKDKTEKVAKKVKEGAAKTSKALEILIRHITEIFKEAFEDIRDAFRTNISEGIFQAITGQIKGLRSIMKQFGLDMARVFSNLAAEATMRGIMGDWMTGGTSKKPFQWAPGGAIGWALDKLFGGGGGMTPGGGRFGGHGVSASWTREEVEVRKDLNHQIVRTKENLKDFEVQKDRNIEKLNILEQATDAIRNGLTRFAEGLASAWKAMTLRIAAAWDAAMDMVYAAVDRVWSILKMARRARTTAGIFIAVTAAMDLMAGLGAITSTGGGAGGGSSAGIDVHMGPPGAKGGLIKKPTYMLAGEAGPEALIPLSKMGSFGNVTVNITEPVFLEDDAAQDRFVRLIENAVVRATDRRSGGTDITL